MLPIVESSFFCAVSLLFFEIIALCIGAKICFREKDKQKFDCKKYNLENNQIDYFKISCWKLYFRVIYSTIVMTVLTTSLILLIRAMKGEI